MSLILDALNKADNERSKDAPPSLSSDHDLTSPHANNNVNTKLILGLSALVCLLLLTVVYMSLSNKQDTAPQKKIVDSQSTESDFKETLLPNRNVKDIPEITDRIDSRTDTKNDTERTASDTYALMKQKLIDAQYKQAARDSEEENNKKQNPPAETSNSNKVASIYEQNEAPKKEQQKAPTTPPKVKRTKTLSDYPTLSFIGELSHSVQKTIPTLMYREHVHDGQTNFVTLNNNKRQKGQQVANKIYLEEILPDGIILRYESLKFKMKALNSWVNI